MTTVGVGEVKGREALIIFVDPDYRGGEAPSIKSWEGFPVAYERMAMLEMM